MNHWRNTCNLSAVFLAAILFLGFSLGGEFLHEQLHHHETQASNDDCVIHQLQAQALLGFAVVLLASRLVFVDNFLSQHTCIIRSAYYSLDRGRSPPFSRFV